jgi:hypothetical protein
MMIQQSMARKVLLLNYHAFAAIPWLITVTFSTPTPVFDIYLSGARPAKDFGACW